MDIINIDKEDVEYCIRNGFAFASDLEKRNAEVMCKLLKATYGLESIKLVSKETVLNDAFKYIELLGNERIMDIMGDIKYHFYMHNNFIKYGNDLFDYEVGIVFPQDENDESLFDLPGRIDYIMLSDKVTELSKVSAAHELIHSLKDTHGAEMKNRFITGEVLPILFEMIIAYNEKPELARIIYLYRLNASAEDVPYYYYIKNYYQKKNDYSKYIESISVEYLNAHYLALVLFDLYLQDSNLLIKKINEVLLHDKTTRELLTELDAYKPISDVQVGKTLKRIHKIL